MSPPMEVQPGPGSPHPDSPRNRVLRWLSSGVVGVLVLLALGGAATHPAGVLIGLPSLGTLASALLAGLAVRASGIAFLGPFLLPAAAVLAGGLGGAFAALLLFSGPPLLTFVFAALVFAIAARRAQPPRALLLPVVFALYAAVSYEVQTRVGPEGDEPQYLMVTDSLIRDHDLVLDQDFEEARYTAFFSRPLKPDFRVRGPEGQIYSLHAVGLSLLILPAYALGGYPGASFFLAFLAALLVRELRRLVALVSGDQRLAEGTAWLAALSPPMIHFAGLIFTEIPAGLLLCLGLRSAVFGRSPRAGWVAASCAAALPWLNVRYSILALGVAVAMVARWWGEGRASSGERGVFPRLLAPALIPVASALALGLYHFELWGFFDPRRVYGQRREFSLGVLPEGLPGLFFDQEFGLFVYAPIFVLAIAGSRQVWRRSRPLALAALVAGLGVIFTASVWPMWRGGFNPPGRFLVPLVSLLTVGLALSLRRGIRPAAALLFGWSLWCGLFGALNIETIHRDRDGVAPFFRTQSGAREWTAVLPSFVLSEDRPTRVLAWPWVVLLGMPLLSAALPGDRERTPGFGSRQVLVAVSVMMATAVLADRLSPRPRNPERDATRLLGSPSLALPSFHFQPSTEAVWKMDLFYEPHRFPAGLTFATALELGARGYEIELASPDHRGAEACPSLVLRHRRSGRTASVPTMATAGGLRAAFALDLPGEYDLSLRGGDPALFQQVRLAVSGP